MDMMKPFDITPLLDPQMATVLVHQRELAGAVADSGGDPAELRAGYRQSRQYWNADRPELVQVRDTVVPGPVGAIPVRLYYPNVQPLLPAVVYLHGGGWVVGDIDTHDKIMRLLALDSGAVVVGVDYRLAPEHKFPTPIDETLAVVRQLTQRGRDWGIDPARVAVAGDSAGAHLGLAACLLNRDEDGPPLRAATLFYGVFGLRDSPSRRKFGSNDDGLTEQDIKFYADCLLRGPEDLDDPRFDLLRNDLRGLPPQYVMAAALDPLLDDSLVLADLLQAAGVERELVTYDGVLHGFLHYSRMLDVARAALRDSGLWLRQRLTESP